MGNIDGDNNGAQAESHEVDASVRAGIEKATKNFRSQCWKEYVPTLEDGVVVQGKCKHCDDVISARHGAGTSALRTHLKICRKRTRALRIVEDLTTTLRSPCGSRLKDWSYDPDVSRQELMRMISLHGVPFLFIEYDRFRRFIAGLNPLFKMPCRTTARNGCMKAFQEKKTELNDIFKNENYRFSLTIYMSMLQTAMKFRAAFDTLKDEDQKYTFTPSDKQWTRAEVLCKVLEVFKDATEPISHLHHMWKIKLTLDQESSTEIPEIANSHILLCVPVVFDPRFKLKFLEFLFTKCSPTKAKHKIGTFGGYFQQMEPNVTSAHQGGVNLEEHLVEKDPWVAWDQQLNNDIQNHMATELDWYLEENPVAGSKEFDILKWWMGNTLKYLTLARISRYVLAIPTSTVESDLVSETVEALICTQDWYRAEGSTGFSLASIHDLLM
ncbi:hypothetical protein U9M48_001991, partial [Paspalum notatum var. saurae]